jgi:hypothetical protein
MRMWEIDKYEFTEENIQKYRKTYRSLCRKFIQTRTPTPKLSIACRKRLKLFQLDVKTAFLHGLIDETIYLEPPQGFTVDKWKVCLLRKSLYGSNNF